MLSYNNNLTKCAKELRKNMTQEEKHLWYDFLSDYPMRFQRQKGIGRYIVDFYCHKASLIIELDGSQHYTENADQYDKNRTEFFKTKELEVIRFTNRDINLYFEAVCRQIDDAVKKRR